MRKCKSAPTLKKGAGQSDSPDIAIDSCDREQSRKDNCKNEENTLKKDIIVESEPISLVPKKKNITKSERTKLPSDAILTQLKRKYRNKGKKLLEELAGKSDFSYDENGLISIENRKIPGV